MDDADLAGPLLFGFCFGMFLLLVRRVSDWQAGLAACELTTQSGRPTVWQTAIWLYLRRCIAWRPFNLFPPQLNVADGDRRISRVICAWLLSPTSCHHLAGEYRPQSRQHRRLRSFDNKYILVRILGKWYIR